MQSTELALPTLDELVKEEAKSYEQNALTVLLNQTPPPNWLKEHPTAKTKNDKGVDVPVSYLPIDKVEYLLTRMFKKWWLEVRAVQSIANSVVVTVRLYTINPITGETMFNDGVGAAPIQTDKGAGAMEWDKAKAHGVMIAAPAAESYAFKDAAEKFGRLFGKDLSRNGTLSYDALLKRPPSLEDLQYLFDMKKEALTPSEIKDAQRILKNREEASYSKLQKLLQSK